MDHLANPTGNAAHIPETTPTRKSWRVRATNGHAPSRRRPPGCHHKCAQIAHSMNASLVRAGVYGRRVGIPWDRGARWYQGDAPRRPYMGLYSRVRCTKEQRGAVVGGGSRTAPTTPYGVRDANVVVGAACIGSFLGRRATAPVHHRKRAWLARTRTRRDPADAYPAAAQCRGDPVGRPAGAGWVREARWDSVGPWGAMVPGRRTASPLHGPV